MIWMIEKVSGFPSLSSLPTTGLLVLCVCDEDRLQPYRTKNTRELGVSSITRTIELNTLIYHCSCVLLKKEMCYVLIFYTWFAQNIFYFWSQRLSHIRNNTYFETFSGRSNYLIAFTQNPYCPTVATVICIIEFSA